MGRLLWIQHLIDIMLPPKPVIIYVISYNIWPRYNGIRLYLHWHSPLKYRDILRDPVSHFELLETWYKIIDSDGNLEENMS